MGDYIEVNITTLEQDIKSLESKLQEIRGDMTGMFDIVAELDTMWDGPANQAFVQQFTHDKEIFGIVCETVEDVIESMEEAKVAYRKCEENVAEQINSIRI